MGMYIAILPDAESRHAEMGVTPSHGLDGRIGIAAQADVAQPQSKQRHAEPEASTSRTRFPVRRPPKCRVHSRIDIGTGLQRPKRVSRKPGG